MHGKKDKHHLCDGVPMHVRKKMREKNFTRLNKNIDESVCLYAIFYTKNL